ncbi:MAG: SAM-dependent methyltransferase [Xanthomonadales bacterium]|nr:SAM-dependent methyltransferase [Xanthomonadales bacterium]MDH4018514.1 SAM-dependent methyltransferase [Xanthomonadales bacterium]
MCSANTNSILPEPPEELKHLSTQLASRIRETIDRKGPIPFSEYMEMALYEPGLGYYSAGLQKFGEGGDFVTAPQLGDVFARCLAKQIEQVSAELGQFEIIEAGAGSGILAADLLKTLESGNPPTRYRILERSGYLRQVQKETLGRLVPQWMDRISWLDAPPEENWQGVFLANEVLDALTVERFCVESEDVRQLQVANGPAGFDWHKGNFSNKTQAQIQAVLSGLAHYPASGYCSEVNTSLPAWLQTVTSSLQKGLALFIDYGYTRKDYYQPQRRDGTLICHYRHRAHDDPFTWPGLTDISASVDFTALAQAADECGLEVSGYTTQVMFLMACGLDQLISESMSLPEVERVSMNNQIRRLTLPGEMGERFQVMALSRGLEEELSEDLIGFSISDLCHRL